MSGLSRRTRLAAVAALAFAGAANAAPPIERLQLPPGFTISIYAENVDNARAMAWGERGTLFVGSREAGKVYALTDADGDGRAETIRTIARGLRMPAGLAFRDGSLYVSAVSKILRYDGIEGRLDDPPQPVVVVDDLPSEGHHGWRYIAFGPDGKLHVPLGAPCNICDRDGFALILRMNPDGSGRETIARGVRNTVGFDWQPGSGRFWFTDNGRDWMGDDQPHDELNVLTEPGQHFGYPYCHAGVPDPEFGAGKSCDDYVAPAARLGPHTAALGMAFYDAGQFPAEYRGDAIIALHGSWNRSQKIGYEVVRAKIDGTTVSEVVPFVTGFLQGQRHWGRPADVIVAPDGAVLISDDYANAIYRVGFTGNEFTGTKE